MDDNTFHFRIIDTSDGNQIIDSSLRTPYNSLTPSQMETYIEMDNRLTYMDRQRRKERRAAEHKRKLERNPFYKLAYMCGFV